MDPLTALGLTANILQFVNFSMQLFHGAQEIYFSGDTAEDKSLEVVTSEMKRFSSTLSSSAGSPQTDDEKGLCRLAEECKILSEQILQLLEKIKPKDPKSKSQSFRSALKTKFYGKEKRELESRLDKCRSQLALQFQCLMRFLL